MKFCNEDKALFKQGTRECLREVSVREREKSTCFLQDANTGV